MKRFVMAIASASLLACAMATSVLELSVEELFLRADRVIYGVVESVTAEEPPATASGTIVTIQVERSFSSDGAAAPETSELRFGVASNTQQGVSAVDDLPLPEPGDRILVALYQGDRLISPVVGFWQGLWTVGEDGLVDLRGRVLGLDGEVLGLGAPERDADRVLEAVFRALRGETGRFSDDLAPTEEAAMPDQADSADRTDRLRLRLELPEDPALRQAFESAAAAWTGAGATVTVEVQTGAEDRVRIGSPDAMGPDALAITRRVPDRAGVEILLRPGRNGRRLGVLAQTLGQLLGLPASPSGLRSGLVPPDRSVGPSIGDARRLVELSTGQPEDLDGDGVVGLYDLALLAAAYGSTGTRLPADLDDSGKVDERDLEILRAAYDFGPASREPPEDRTSSGDGSGGAP